MRGLLHRHKLLYEKMFYDTENFVTPTTIYEGHHRGHRLFLKKINRYSDRTPYKMGLPRQYMRGVIVGAVPATSLHTVAVDEKRR